MGDQCRCLRHFVIVSVGLSVLADVAGLKNHRAQAQGVQPRAELEPWNRLPAQRDPALRTPWPSIGARLGGRDSPATNFVGVVRGLAHERHKKSENPRGLERVDLALASM